MSMILGLVTLSDENIARVLDHPPLVWRVIAPDEPELYESAVPPPPPFLSRLFGKKAPPPPPELELSEHEGADTDLDKAWHGIHYLLTGTTWEGDPPQNLLLLGGEEVGDIDVGYGPARVLRAAETEALLGAVAALGNDEIAARFDPEDMTEKAIYPEIIWKRDPAEDDAQGYLREYAHGLREFLESAVEHGLGVVITMM